VALSAQLDSHIDHVKVYAAGATVTRLTSLDIDFAVLPVQVELVGLPLALDDRSVRVRLAGSLSAPVIATDVRIGLSVPPRSAIEMPLRADDLRQAELEVQQLTDLMTLLDREIAVLQQFTVPDRPIPHTGAPPASPTNARLALANFQDEQIRARLLERRQTRERLRHANEHLQDLLQQQAQASSAREVKAHELRKTAIVRLERTEMPAAQLISAADRSHLQLMVEYFVPGARWTPTYICRLDSAANTATIALRALICQNTGEDWSSVQLELSTAEPQAWCELPELSALRLGRTQQPAAKRGWRQPPVGAAALFADFDRQRESVPVSQHPQSELSAVRGRSLPDLKLQSAPIKASSQWLETAANLVAEAAEDQSDPNAVFWVGDAAPDRSAPQDLTLLGAAGSALPEPQTQRIARSRKASQSTAQPTAPIPAAMMSAAQAAAPIEAAKPLAYGMMRLGAVENLDQRGRLTIASPEEAYAESLNQQQVIVKFGSMAVVQQAIDTAESCLSLPLPSGGESVRSIAGSFDYAYRADGRVDVRSDGQFHSVALTCQSTAVNLRYVVVPREDTSVFRIAQLVNPLQSPLLAGTADVYVNGEYILSTSIATVPARGQMELGLGVEQAIKVARNAFFQEVRSGKILVAFNELRHRIEVAIVNHLPQPIQIEVRERLPVPQEGAKVDVEVNAVAPDWERYEQIERHAAIQGGYRWQVQIPSGGRSTLSAQYTIKTFADSELIGGNRREEG